MTLAKAKGIWETFHAKDPRELIEVDHTWPRKWGLAGRVIRTWYRSDKWNADGDYDDYYHDHGAEVFAWEPMGRGAPSWLTPSIPPIKRSPRSGAVLGYSLGWEFERDSDGERMEAETFEDTLLCADPSGLYLFTVTPDEGVTALFYGAGLHVKDVGIVG